MDSLSQIALGAAVSVAVMRRRTAVWKAAAWGAVAGTLPDLDVLIDHGDPILDMVLHRAETHALLWLTLFSLPFAALVARLHHEWAQWRRWWLALWLVLVTHPLLDAMTVYGTQLLLPFTNQAYGVGSIFIIDPLYTLPLLLGTGWALASRGSGTGLRANGVGLLLSTAYLGWGMAVQQHVQTVAAASLTQQGVHVDRMLVTPTAFNSVLWRVVVVSGGSHLEGFHSLLDAPGPIQFKHFDRGAAFEAPLQDHVLTQHIRRFSNGFYKLHRQGNAVQVADLRMGQDPHYSFNFTVAQVDAAGALQPLTTALAASNRPELGPALRALWQRLQGRGPPAAR